MLCPDSEVDTLSGLKIKVGAFCLLEPLVQTTPNVRPKDVASRWIFSALKQSARSCLLSNALKISIHSGGWSVDNGESTNLFSTMSFRGSPSKNSITIHSSREDSIRWQSETNSG